MTKQIKIKYIIYLNILFLFYSFVGVFAKLASQQTFFSKSFIQYYLIELLILGIHAIFWQQILKKLSLSIAYSHFALFILWNFLWAHIFFNEQITLNNIFGSILIIFGIFLVVKR